MLTVEQMIWCVQQLYPGTQQGRDYLIGHPVDSDTLVQNGPAFVAVWKNQRLTQPTDDQVQAVWLAQGSTYLTAQAEVDARARRDALLAAADYMVNRAIDRQDAAAQAAASAYRQALRDVPEQAGFPNTISWPTSPA